MKKNRAKFMLLCHGRVGTASLLEGMQGIDEVFVPSYWHTDQLIENGSLDLLSSNDTRLSEQYSLPIALDDVELGIIYHKFPTCLIDAKSCVANLKNILTDDAKIFVWTRHPVENMVSSYKTYLTAYYIFKICEGNENAVGIYSAFNTEKPLDFLGFLDKYAYIADYFAQRDLYSDAGYRVHLRPFKNLKIDLRGEIEYVLNESGIAFKGISVKPIDYPRSDNWALQVSFAFRNRFSIDGLPLTVGYFNPARPFPNQGSLTLEIQENIFVAPDQWFRIPYAYKRRIQASLDPWQIVPKTRHGYDSFERKVQALVSAALAVEEGMFKTAERRLTELGIKLDFS